MPRPIEASRQLWNPLATLEITDPDRHCTCIGATKNGTPCGNRVSKQSRAMASHSLELVALASIDESLSKLQTIAELLLCKRRHQVQAASLLGRWYSRLGLSAEPTQGSTPVYLHSSHQPRTRSEQHQATREERSIPGGFTSLPSDSQQAQGITAAMVQENQIPFHVSFSRRAVAIIRATTGHAGAIVFRSFRKGREMSDVECGICREKSSEDTAYLSCEDCAGEFHWGCMYAWLTHRSPQSNFTCPIWYETFICCSRFAKPCRTLSSSRKDRLFDGFYVARPVATTSTLGESSEQIPSPVEDTGHYVSSVTTMPADTDERPRSCTPAVTSFLGRSSRAEAIGSLNHPPLMGGVRRSTRVTRRPEYFIPS